MKANGPVVIDRRTFSPVYEMRAWRRALLAPVAYPLSMVYRLGVRAWRGRAVRAFDIGTPVVSVGSISVGGTGKTPLSMLIAAGLRDRGMKVAIVSRGYKRRRGESPLVVSDFEGPRADIEEAGDEPYLMAVRLPGVGVVIDSDRVRGAVRAREALRPDVILLDDGFQCRGLAKRLDIVTLGADALAPGAGFLPWGPLREGPSAVGHDDFVVLVARSETERGQMEDLKARGGAGLRLRTPYLFFASYVDAVIVEPDGAPAGEAAGLGRAALVSGIARPEAFEETCDRLGIEAGAVFRFDDHHWYGEADADMIEGEMKRRQCLWLATTEKDIYRLPAGLRQRARAVRICLSVSDPDFVDRVAGRVGLS
jgi:tetraacyldisaccharide 4'-kinase